MRIKHVFDRIIKLKELLNISLVKNYIDNQYFLNRMGTKHISSSSFRFTNIHVLDLHLDASNSPLLFIYLNRFCICFMNLNYRVLFLFIVVAVCIFKYRMLYYI